MTMPLSAIHYMAAAKAAQNGAKVGRPTRTADQELALLDFMEAHVNA
jgi:hypothetical protein